MSADERSAREPAGVAGRAFHVAPDRGGARGDLS
jgi:hypothetical protein